MREFLHTIQARLMTLVLMTTVIALLVAGIALLLNDLSDYRSRLSGELATEARILALSTTPALQFEDRAAAERNVQALQARPEIVAAAIYGANNALYAQYLRPGHAPLATLLRHPVNGTTVSRDRITLTYQIIGNGERIGTIYLQANYDVRGQLGTYVGILAVVTVLSVVVALLLSGRLQRTLARPLQAMTAVADEVIRKRDYSPRVLEREGGELGLVIEAFNRMLDEVQLREQSLRSEIRVRMAAEAALARSNTTLEQTMQALRESDRRKDEFLATLAHELRNPLAPISHAVKLLSYPSITEGQRIWGYELIGRQVRRMALLLDDLLDISRITRGRLELKREYIDLQALIASAVETVRPLIEGRRHVLTVSVPDEPMTLEVDPLRLSQVLSNLLTNAAKYTDEGGHIELTVSLEPQDLVIGVCDNGIGLNAEALPKLFEMFSQVEGAKQRSQGGLGIGLALVKGLVALHGGSVSVESPGLGRGSLFTIRLPRRIVMPQALPAEQTGKEPLRAGGGGLVLIADDNRDGADSLALMLRAAGYDCVVAYSGSEAWEAAVFRHPRVMLLDIGMPGMNGYEVARRVRQHEWGRAVWLIAATGWGQAEDKAEAKAAGFDQHLTKPVSPDRLLHLLTELSRPREDTTDAGSRAASTIPAADRSVSAGNRGSPGRPG
jgi:two-component system, sensor histidine kinase